MNKVERAREKLKMVATDWYRCQNYAYDIKEPEAWTIFHRAIIRYAESLGWTKPKKGKVK